jgi:ribosomal protein L11 methyltransferase
VTEPRILIAPRDFERASAALYRAGFSGAFEEDRAEGAVMVAVFESRRAAALAREMLEADGIACRPEEADAPEDPFAAFRRSASPFRLGSFWIDPGEWGGAPPEDAGTIPLRIPANCAFGTGLHESTRGILRELDAGGLEGADVLDAGCGSAILAIAAVKKGARRAAGFDTDVEAVFEARRNLIRNGAVGKVSLFAGGVEAVAGAFDRVLANMIWEELVPILPAAARLLRPGGVAVVSGILDRLEGSARAGFGRAGLAVAGVAADGEWRTIRAVKT